MARTNQCDFLVDDEIVEVNYNPYKDKRFEAVKVNLKNKRFMVGIQIY